MNLRQESHALSCLFRIRNIGRKDWRSSKGAQRMRCSMERKITVQGGGKIRVKPDLVELTLQIEGRDRKYETAARNAGDQIEKLSSVLSGLGFGEKELKTTGFNVRTEYESVRDQNGEYREQFARYVCSHSLKLTFDFTPERLSETLSGIASSGAEPQLFISFTAKNPEKISSALLRAAAKNAREKARILAKASDAALGELVSIDYGFSDRAFYSNTRVEMQRDFGGAPMMAKAAFGASFAPEELELSDHATFVWELIPKNKEEQK